MLSPKRPISFAAFARSLDLILTRLAWGSLSPRILPPERVAPRATPPTVPASAAPPATNGIFALLAALAGSNLEWPLRPAATLSGRALFAFEAFAFVSLALV